MPLDDKTEVIAHFIGLFELRVEAVRLRFEYDEWLSKLPPDPEYGPLLNVTVNVSAPYYQEDFDPTFRNLKFDVETAFAGSRYALPYLPHSPNGLLVPPYFGFPLDTGVIAHAAGVENPMPYLPPPASMANITFQTNMLSDQDIIWNYDAGLEYIGADAFDSALLALTSNAFSHVPLSAPDLPESEAAIAESGTEIVKTIAALRDQVSEISPEGRDAYVAFGDDVQGITVNGEVVDTAPALQDLSDRFSNDETEEPDESTGEPQGHEILTGDNALINEAAITTNWLDAHVYVVLGDYVTGNAIVQTNLWNDVDTINGVASDIASTTEAFNVSLVETFEVPNETAEGALGPGIVAMTTITGNLVNFNHVQQFNFGNEYDFASVEFSASETFLEMGGNTLYNVFGLLGLGYHYDLIVVGGDMIDVNFVTQTNVLLDPDEVTFSGDFTGTVETSGNLLFNGASINEVGVDTAEDMTAEYLGAAQTIASGNNDLEDVVLTDPAFVGDGVLTALYVAGNIIDVQIVDQVNVLGDPDQVAVAAQTLQSADGANTTVSTGNNELINIATINDLGIDSTVYVGGETYSDALLVQAEFISATDPLAILSPTELASEAVIFLADGMLTEPDQAVGGAIEPEAPGETPVDAMQLLVS